MRHIKTFEQVNSKSVNEAGGKGASLGEMTQAKIPIPPGFVILADVFNILLEEACLAQKIQNELAKTNYKDTNSINRCSNIIRGIVLKIKLPTSLKKEILNEFKKLNCKYVAVRSSATAEDSSTASWAGELETYLNITQKDLMLNVKKCWAFLFTPRAIFYRHAKKMLKKKVSVAVVIQEMIQSEVSGVVFTVHPVTLDRNQMIIEAGWGLGEAIVSGQITPDSYVISKQNWSIIDINISTQAQQIIKIGKITKMTGVKKIKQNKQKLLDKKIVELAKLCGLIENHYRFPCDIEWAVKEKKIYIVQSRPITTL